MVAVVDNAQDELQEKQKVGCTQKTKQAKRKTNTSHPIVDRNEILKKKKTKRERCCVGFFQRETSKAESRQATK